MALRSPKNLLALCGSSARVRTLAVLANASEPLTGYRIGVRGDIPFPKLYPELERLRRGGLVVRRGGRWILADPLVRLLFRSRFPARPPLDWFSKLEQRRAEDESILARFRTLPGTHLRPGWSPRDPERFQRDPEKDRILARLGLRPSLHG